MVEAQGRSKSSKLFYPTIEGFSLEALASPLRIWQHAQQTAFASGLVTSESPVLRRTFMLSRLH